MPTPLDCAHMIAERIVPRMLLLALASLLLIGVAHPATIGQSSSAQTASAGATPSPDREQDLRVAALTAETEVLKQMMENVFSTVYFALATVVVVLISLVGFSWFQNNRIYDRDREAMRNALSASLNAQFVELDKRLSQQIGERAQAFESSTTQKFAAFDAKMAEVFALAIKRTDNLALTVHIDHLSHAMVGPTPRTDFAQFVNTLRGMINRVDLHVLQYALRGTISILETNNQIVKDNRLALIDLSNHLPEECEAFTVRIKTLAS